MTKRYYCILFLLYEYIIKIKFHYQTETGKGREVEEIKFGELLASFFLNCLSSLGHCTITPFLLVNCNLLLGKVLKYVIFR